MCTMINIIAFINSIVVSLIENTEICLSDTKIGQFNTPIGLVACLCTCRRKLGEPEETMQTKTTQFAAFMEINTGPSYSETASNKLQMLSLTLHILCICTPFYYLYACVTYLTPCTINAKQCMFIRKRKVLWLHICCLFLFYILYLEVDFCVDKVEYTSVIVRNLHVNVLK